MDYIPFTPLYNTASLVSIHTGRGLERAWVVIQRGMWVTQSRHCQPCTSDDSGYCGAKTSRRWLNTTSPAVVVNQHTAKHNFTPVRSSTTTYCSGWVQPQPPQQQQQTTTTPPYQGYAAERKVANNLIFHFIGIIYFSLNCTFKKKKVFIRKFKQLVCKLYLLFLCKIYANFNVHNSHHAKPT